MDLPAAEVEAEGAGRVVSMDLFRMALRRTDPRLMDSISDLLQAAAAAVGLAEGAGPRTPPDFCEASN
jgi:hypothetical protein